MLQVLIQAQIPPALVIFTFHDWTACPEYLSRVCAHRTVLCHDRSRIQATPQLLKSLSLQSILSKKAAMGIDVNVVENLPANRAMNVSSTTSDSSLLIISPYWYVIEIITRKKAAFSHSDNRQSRALFRVSVVIV